MRGSELDWTIVRPTATERVIAEVGISGAATREIARAARCAEGTLYVHFDNRFALFAGLFEKHVTIAPRAMQALAESAGKDDPQRNLIRALEAGFGPERFRAHIHEYILREQKIGRIARHVEPDVVSEALLSLLFVQTFNDGLLPASPGPVLDVDPLLRRLIV
jgi:AcrR family transcriptional regulator